MTSIKVIDYFLNKVTMYLLVRYCLAGLWFFGFCSSFFNIVPFTPLAFVASLFVIFISCIVVNRIFEIIFRTPSHRDSTYITALILSLVMGPEVSFKGILWLIFVSAAAIASKYLLAFNKKHIFNPAAFGMASVAFFFHYYPSWWVGDASMIVPVLFVGFLITRKVQRIDLVTSFLLVYVVFSVGLYNLSVPHIFLTFKYTFAYSPILFFAFIMLTEPATTPPTRILRVAYGAFVAVMLAPVVHIGSFYFSPELALIAGNIISFTVSPKLKLKAVLKGKVQIAANAYDFVFSTDKKVLFKPGQYMEWMLPHESHDARGTRRYFTIASSPTEQDLRIGAKFYEKPSSYKKALLALQRGDNVIASQLAGDFTLPRNINKKLVFLGGGIGITPFRSMIKYLIDRNEPRDIILLYAVKKWQDVAYQEILDEAVKKLHIKVIYVLSDSFDIPPEIPYETGVVTQELIKKYVRDFNERIFYISGPKTMTDAFSGILLTMGVHRMRIKTDFFPGYA